MIAEKTWDAIVIGGGPAGSTAAYILSSRGYRVLLVDKKNFPRPKLCAGLLTRKSVDLIRSIFDLKVDALIDNQLILNHTRNYRIFYENTEIVRGRLDYPFYFVDRCTYDHFWLQKAAEAGVHTLTGQAACHVAPESGHVTLADGTRARARAIIGADGAWSISRRAVIRNQQQNCSWNNRLAMTIESCLPVTEKTSDKENYASLHFGFIPWGYAWSFPHGRHHVLGIAGLRRKYNRPLLTSFNRFLESVGAQKSDLSMTKGYPLPMGNPAIPPGRARVLLTGDACGLPDPLLGEGIYYAHRSAQLAARAIMECSHGYANLVRSYQNALADHVLTELRWITFFRNLLFAGGRTRRFRGLKLLMRWMPKKVEAAVQGQISFAGLIYPGFRHPIR